MSSVLSAITKAKKNLISPQRMSLSSSSHLPTGVITALIPEIEPLSYLKEFLPPALKAGNAIILVSATEPSWSKDLESFVQDFAKQNSFYQEDLIQIVVASTPDDIEILTSHPTVNAVYGAGSSQDYLNLMKNELFQRKKHFWRGSSSNSFLILADADLNKAFDSFWKSVTFELGRHPTSTKKLLLLESHLPEFRIWLENQRADVLPTSFREPAEALLKQIKSESGKVLLQGSPTLVLDLPHCSELQQIEIHQPLALISTVKYPHEMVKWNNTGQYAMSAVIFGSVEKAQSIAQKLDVGTIWINRIYDPSLDALPIGNKQSHFGLKDLSPSGDFFTDRKSIF